MRICQCFLEAGCNRNWPNVLIDVCIHREGGSVLIAKKRKPKAAVQNDRPTYRIGFVLWYTRPCIGRRRFFIQTNSFQFFFRFGKYFRLDERLETGNFHIAFSFAICTPFDCATATATGGHFFAANTLTLWIRTITTIINNISHHLFRNLNEIF